MPILMKTKSSIFILLFSMRLTTPTLYLFTIHQYKVERYIGHLDRGDHDEKLVIRDLPILVLVGKADISNSKDQLSVYICSDVDLKSS